MCYVYVQAGNKFESHIQLDEGQPNGVAASPDAGIARVIDCSTPKSVRVCLFSVTIKNHFLGCFTAIGQPDDAE